MIAKYAGFPSLGKEQGIGLVEVVISLVIIMVAALGIGNLQTSSLIAAQASSVHFAIDQLSSEMLETLRAHSEDASASLFDHSVDTPSSNDLVLAWSARVAEHINTGSGQISCGSEFCDVQISWIEEIDGTERTRNFNTRTPL